jgi:hypothetical protein
LCEFAAQCAFTAFLRDLRIPPHRRVSTTRETAETANTTVNAHKRCRADPSLRTVGR